MTAVDTNILVYAHRTDSPFFAAAREAMRQLVEGAAPWAIPWPVLHEFLGIVTHPKVYRPPTPVDRAVMQVEALLGAPSLRLIGETTDHWPELRSALLAGKVRGPMVHDARIAAICRQHGVRTLWSADRDYSRFPGLRIVNPLIKGGA
jgi:uncharacterized protein